MLVQSVYLKDLEKEKILVNAIEEVKNQKVECESAMSNMSRVDDGEYLLVHQLREMGEEQFFSCT